MEEIKEVDFEDYALPQSEKSNGEIIKSSAQRKNENFV